MGNSPARRRMTPMVAGVVCDAIGSVISGITAGVMAQVILGVIDRVEAAVASTSPSRGQAGGISAQCGLWLGYRHT